ncbi:putative transposase [Trichonephila clavipes]|nr:putative transposase [Trichonephila clavipes]
MTSLQSLRHTYDATSVIRKQKYPGETLPNESTITLLVQRFRNTGSVADRKRPVRASIVKTEVADVETVLQRSLLKRQSVYINIITEFKSLLKVMKGNLGCSKTAQPVIHHSTNMQMKAKLEGCRDYEAVQKLNSARMDMSEADPQVYVETPLHPEKLTVWCALWAGGIIGPYFKNDEGHNVTVNGDRYRAMITNFFIPELNNHDVQELWFQQDGATCHTGRATIDLLKDTFGDRIISRFGPVNWPPRSCDLTPLDYFLWGYVKSLVYADKPQTLDHLKDNIRRVIADIRP